MQNTGELEIQFAARQGVGAMEKVLVCGISGQCVTEKHFGQEEKDHPEENSG
jgi:hypothetical protein